jgi:hypothetical protein
MAKEEKINVDQMKFDYYDLSKLVENYHNMKKNNTRMSKSSQVMYDKIIERRNLLHQQLTDMGYEL